MERAGILYGFKLVLHTWARGPVPEGSKVFKYEVCRLGIVVMALGRYLMLGYLDPKAKGRMTRSMRCCCNRSLEERTSGAQVLAGALPDPGRIQQMGPILNSSTPTA